MHLHIGVQQNKHCVNLNLLVQRAHSKHVNTKLMDWLNTVLSAGQRQKNKQGRQNYPPRIIHYNPECCKVNFSWMRGGKR